MKRALLFMGLVLPIGLRADVSLPALIASHMVLQRSSHTRIWGKATPGEEVTVSLETAKAVTTAGADGQWHTELDISSLGEGPFDLTVTAHNKIVVSDVLVGEVWLCSGQSNMAFTVAMDPANQKVIAESANSRIRQFSLNQATAVVPQNDCQGKWLTAAPAVTGAFTAVGYFFARSLQEELHVPVGLIRDAWGGTCIDSWLSRDGYAGSPALKSVLAGFLQHEAAYPAREADYARTFPEWQEKYGRQDHPSVPDPFLDPGGNGWKPVTVPGNLRNSGLPDAGAVWVRRQVLIPPEATGKKVEIDLGAPRGFETVYWDHAQIGNLTPETYPGTGGRRRYAIPPPLVQPGVHLLSVRLFSPAGNAGFDGYLVEALPYPQTSPTLAGTWEGKAEFELPTLTRESRNALPAPMSAPARPQDVASSLYNGMIAPVLTATFRGVIWYQGESNVSRAFQYRKFLPALIEDWRKHAGTGFPFIICQLPGFGPKQPVPAESQWAELRESQQEALTVADTSLAVLIDLGEAADVHPKDKRTPAERLARIALARSYGRQIPGSGPVFDSMQVEGNAIHIHFRGASGGLKAKPLPSKYTVSSVPPVTQPLVRNSPESALEGFCICGADRKWVWADARIDGDSVVVSSPLITNPVAVRYAWADNPTCNLHDGAGLPVAPFRTDNFRLSTQREGD